MSKTPKKFQNHHDPLFTILAEEVRVAIARHQDGKTQREHFEELTSAECAFRETVLGYRISTEIYKRFVQLIRVVNNNILSARPYFRESSETFSSGITPALKSRDADALKKYGINFHFVKFCKDHWIGLWPKKLEIAYKRVEKARTVLVELNMPLAINRARIFFGKTPKGHLTFMDMIESASMGLQAGIDKYTGEFKPNFIGVCIGRIVGNLIDIYSETQIHFYPGDRRILYRANSIRGRQGITDIVELTKAVNDSFAVDLAEGRTAPKATTATELAYLLHAASLLSADANDGEEGYGVYNFTPDQSENAEELLGKKQEIAIMCKLARKLPLINQKVLRLKGVEI